MTTSYHRHGWVECNNTACDKGQEQTPQNFLSDLDEPQYDLVERPGKRLTKGRERLSIWCRWGFHSWVFCEMTEPRMVEVPPHSAWICDLTERCRRCPLRRTRRGAAVPKRVRL